MQDKKLWYGLLLFALAVLLSIIIELVTIFKLGRVVAPTFNLVMFYITLFFAFVIFFGSIAFLTGTLIGLMIEKTGK